MSINSRRTDHNNHRWLTKELAKAYKYENPDWTLGECLNKADEVHKGLRALNESMRHNNKKYYDKFIPLSIFEMDNGEYLFFETEKTIDDYI